MRTSPMVPPRRRTESSRTSGTKRIHMPSMQNTSRARASSTTWRASAASTVKGFSQSTALPASMHRMALSRCAELGVAT